MTLIPMAASAATATDIAAKIEQFYNPAIEFRQVSSSWSLYGCSIEEFQVLGQDPVTLERRTVNVSIYRAQGEREGQHTVIILPPTGGVNILDRGYANELCSSGLTVAMISQWEHQTEVSVDFSMHDNGALRAIAASRHVIEFLETQHPRAIGILGTSVGAIAGFLVLSIEPRISSAALIVGSARFADVIAESDETGASKLRQDRMKILGLKNRDEYRRAVRQNVNIEPSTLIGYTGMKPALVVSADADTTVPTEYQLELANLLQAEVHLQLRGNHRQAITETFCQHRGDIVNFFRRTLRGI